MGAAGGYDSGESGITDTPQPRLTHRVRGRRNLRLLLHAIEARPRSVFAFYLHAILPTLRVGPARALRVHVDSERQSLRYYAELGND